MRVTGLVYHLWSMLGPLRHLLRLFPRVVPCQSRVTQTSAVALPRRPRPAAATFALLSAGTLALGLVLCRQAHAQQQVGTTPYYAVVETNQAWEPLLNPTVASNVPSYANGGYNPEVTLPFPFRYFASDFDRVTLSAGVAFLGGFTGTSYFNTGYGTSSPNNYIAPYWDYIEYADPDSGILYEVIGRAPSREFAIEWRNARNGLSDSGSLNFQLRLQEGAGGRFQIRYGPSSRPTAEYGHTMAMEDATGATIILFSPSSCTTSCSFTDFQARIGQRLTLTQDAGIELVAVSVDAPRFATLGTTIRIPVSVRNDHVNPIGPFDVRVSASEDERGTNRTALGTGQLALGPLQTGSTEVVATLPAALGERSYYLFLDVDPTNAVGEPERRNNEARSPGVVRLLPSRPDLRVDSVRLSANRVQAGDSLDVFVVVSNAGSIPVPAAEIGVVLSTNPVISPTDGLLTTITRDLGSPETFTATVSVTIDADTNTGTYYVGALADPGNAVAEVDEANNGRAASPIEVLGGGVEVLTTQLPQGFVGETYFALLRARGGSGQYRWRVSGGMQPQDIGIGLAANGQFFGRARSVGCRSFTVEASDARDEALTDTQDLTLCIVDEVQPLTIVSRSVPSAIVGQLYSFQLVSTGGAVGSPMPTWTANGLPDGFSVTPAGVLTGLGTTETSASFEVTASNGVDPDATRTLTLEVRESSTLQIEPTPLPPGRVGQPYLHQLQASGGIEPINWFLRVDSLSELGLDLSPEGELSGIPQRAGRFSFTVDVRDSGPDGSSTRDENTFELIIADDGTLLITTGPLPAAQLGTGYDRSIAAVGGLPPYDWQFQGTLPEGIREPTTDGVAELRIIGTPSEEGLFRFRVTARDREGREASRAYVLVVGPAATAPGTAVDEDSGCATSGDGGASSGAASALLLLIGLGLSRLTRRSRAVEHAKSETF